MLQYQNYESSILIKEEWQSLRYKNIQEGSVKVFGVCHDNNENISYSEGIDYIIDYPNGRIKATSMSNIEGYEHSPFYKTEKFRHENMEKYGNYEYMVYISYLFDDKYNITVDQIAQKRNYELGNIRISKTIKKMNNGQKIKYIVFGDSISTGCEALLPEEAYYNLFKTYLENTFGCHIELINKSIGGESTNEAVLRYQEDIIDNKPDLVTISYGMNDQCWFNLSTGALTEYENRIKAMIEDMLQSGIEVVIITPCCPNELWFHTTNSMDKYVQVLIGLANTYHLPIADVHYIWGKELEVGKVSSSLLLNDINHPTSYGHNIYFQALKALV